jgi:hypothetical protein
MHVILVLIYFRSVNKHGRHKQFLFLIGFRAEDLKKSANQKQELPMVAMPPTEFRFNWQSSFRGDDVLEINQSETRIVCVGHVC